MFHRDICGQEAMEFILITALVFFGALFTIMIFGEKISGFFTSGSSIHQTSKTSVKSLTASNVPSFQVDYETSVDIPRPAILETMGINGSENMDVIDIDGIKVHVPTDIGTLIQTTGSSGGTDQIVDAIKALVSQMQTIADEDPSNTDLQDMVSVASHLADKGYLVADAEEWYEAAARRLTSGHEEVLPEDNQLCEFGNYLGDHDCDHSVASENFLYSDVGGSNIKTNIEREVGSFTSLITELKGLDAGISDERINTIVSSIGLLSDEIIEISDNVKAQAKDVSNLEDLNSGVASKTTDIKAAMIAYYKEKMAEKAAAAASESVVNDASINLNEPAAVIETTK